MKRMSIFERSVRDTLRVCLAGRPIPPEFLAPIQVVETPPQPAPDGANIQIDFHRKGDDDAAF
jgi:hypothetical protein